MNLWMTISATFMGLLYTAAGVWHFLKPRMYLKIMPPYLPAPMLLVQISGIAEILCGIGLLIPATRSIAAWGTIALLIAVFPANVYMMSAGSEVFKIPQWVLIARLPLQLVLIAWAYAYT